MRPSISLTSDGRLAGVQFVLQDEQVSMSCDPPPSDVEVVGWPVFEVSGGPATRYLDEPIAVPFERAGDSLALRIGSTPSQRWLRVGNGLALGLSNDALVGMVLGPLSERDWHIIHGFGLPR